MHMLMDLSAGRQTRMPRTSGMTPCSSTPKHTPNGGLGKGREVTAPLQQLQMTNLLLT